MAHDAPESGLVSMRRSIDVGVGLDGVAGVLYTPACTARPRVRACGGLRIASSARMAGSLITWLDEANAAHILADKVRRDNRRRFAIAQMGWGMPLAQAAFGQQRKNGQTLGVRTSSPVSR